MKSYLKATDSLRQFVARVLLFCIAASVSVVLQSCGGLNGTEITPPEGPGGLCQLIVHNNYDQDLVLRLYDVKNPKVCLRYVYISSHGTVKIDKLAPGNLTMKYSRGSEWDASSKQFLHDRANFESDEILKLEEMQTETKTNEGVRKEHHYSVLEFTFNASGGKGNTTVSPIDDKEFQAK